MIQQFISTIRSGISANRNEWTKQLLKTDLDGAQSYYTVDGRPLGEKNPKWLQY